MTLQNYDEAVAYLLGRINFERHPSLADRTAFKLDRMRRLLALLDDPHEKIPAVHIAGTKGKGSTAAMTAAALTAAGYRVGLYTSPHLEMFEERMQVNGRLPTSDEFISLTESVAAAALELERQDAESVTTCFEAITAMAWVYFVRQSADIAVLEVGLGGRLDATNLCHPVVTAITNISRDHTSLLGETPAEIALEKAGIVKKGVPCISGVTDPEAAAVIRQVCRRLAAPLVEIEGQFTTTDAGLDQPRKIAITVGGEKHAPLDVPLPGRHQADNAAVALHLLDELTRQGWKVTPQHVASGWSRLQWPARIEVVSRQPTIVLDAAHNWASAGALVRTLETDFPSNHRILLFAGSREKDVAGMLRRLEPAFDTVVLTSFSTSPRSVPPAQLHQIWRSMTDRPAHLFERSEDAFAFCRRIAGRHSLICATGSFFLAAEIRPLVISAADRRWTTED